MAAAEERFEIPRQKRRESLLLAAGLFLMGVAAIVLLVLDWPVDLVRGLVFHAVAASFVGGAAAMVRFARSLDRHTVVVADEAIRIGDRRIGWNEIDAIRDASNRWPRRVDLLGDGRVLGSLSREIDDLPLLLAHVLQRVQIERRVLPRHAGTPHPRGDVVLFFAAASALIGAAVWVALTESPWLGWGAAAVLVFSFASDFRSTIQRVEFDDDGMRLRFLLGSRFIPRSEIRRLDLMVMKEIYTIAELAGGRTVDLKISGADPFLVYETARRAYPELAGWPRLQQV